MMKFHDFQSLPRPVRTLDRGTLLLSQENKLCCRKTDREQTSEQIFATNVVYL